MIRTKFRNGQLGFSRAKRVHRSLSDRQLRLGAAPARPSTDGPLVLVLAGTWWHCNFWEKTWCREGSVVAVIPSVNVVRCTPTSLRASTQIRLSAREKTWPNRNRLSCSFGSRRNRAEGLPNLRRRSVCHVMKQSKNGVHREVGAVVAPETDRGLRSGVDNQVHPHRQPAFGENHLAPGPRRRALGTMVQKSFAPIANDHHRQPGNGETKDHAHFPQADPDVIR